MIKLSDYISVHLGDNVEFMKTCSDDQFDIAIVDPPYGINAPNMTMGSHPTRKKGGYPGVSVAQKLKKGS